MGYHRAGLPKGMLMLLNEERDERVPNARRWPAVVRKCWHIDSDGKQKTSVMTSCWVKSRTPFSRIYSDYHSAINFLLSNVFYVTTPTILPCVYIVQHGQFQTTGTAVKILVAYGRKQSAMEYINNVRIQSYTLHILHNVSCLGRWMSFVVDASLS